jgi:hypothetical protein
MFSLVMRGVSSMSEVVGSIFSSIVKKKKSVLFDYLIDKKRI